VKIQTRVGRIDGPEHDRSRSADKGFLCKVCARRIQGSSGRTIVCSECSVEWPPALLKATIDKPSDYALRLRSGELIYFWGANLVGSFAQLALTHREDRQQIGLSLHRFPNGIEVSLADIVWCAEAPDGS